MKPHVLLDVDGVLNACTQQTDPGWGWGESQLVRVSGFPIRYSPAMVAALNELAEHVEFHWLTTWRGDAPRLLAPAIGLAGEAWPVLTAEERSPHRWWKLTAIRRHLQEHRGQAFWIDDDIAFDDETREWLERTPDVVPICPTTSVGLTREAMTLLVGAVTGAITT